MKVIIYCGEIGKEIFSANMGVCEIEPFIDLVRQNGCEDELSEEYTFSDAKITPKDVTIYVNRV